MCSYLDPSPHYLHSLHARQMASYAWHEPGRSRRVVALALGPLAYAPIDRMPLVERQTIKTDIGTVAVQLLEMFRGLVAIDDYSDCNLPSQNLLMSPLCGSTWSTIVAGVTIARSAQYLQSGCSCN